MVRKILSVGQVMSMAIMHLSVLKEKISLREDLDLGDLDNVCMLMKKKMNLIRVEVKMNWNL